MLRWLLVLLLCAPAWAQPRVVGVLTWENPSLYARARGPGQRPLDAARLGHPGQRQLARPRPGPADPPKRYPPGEKVEVEWNGEWYPATVKQERRGIHLIHYDDYDSEWDEWVGPKRMRSLSSSSSRNARSRH